MHNCVKVFGVEESVPLKISIDRLTYHERGNKPHCHRCDHTNASKIHQIILKVWCAILCHRFKGAVWEHDIKCEHIICKYLILVTRTMGACDH